MSPPCPFQTGYRSKSPETETRRHLTYCSFYPTAAWTTMTRATTERKLIRTSTYHPCQKQILVRRPSLNCPPSWRIAEGKCQPGVISLAERGRLRWGRTTGHRPTTASRLLTCRSAAAQTPNGSWQLGPQKQAMLCLPLPLPLPAAAAAAGNGSAAAVHKELERRV